MNTSFPPTPDWAAALRPGDKLRFVDPGNLIIVPPAGSICEFVRGPRVGEILVRWDKEVGHLPNEQYLYAWRFEPVNPKKCNQTKTMIPKTVAAATTEKAVLEKEKAKLEAQMLKTKTKLDAIAIELHKLNTVLGL